MKYVAQPYRIFPEKRYQIVAVYQVSCRCEIIFIKKNKLQSIDKPEVEQRDQQKDKEQTKILYVPNFHWHDIKKGVMERVLKVSLESSIN